MSSPAQNSAPAPIMTDTRASDSARSSAAINWPHPSFVMAFFLDVRSMVIQTASPRSSDLDHIESVPRRGHMHTDGCQLVVHLITLFS